MKKALIFGAATLGGVGKLPLYPGTWGSLFTLPLVWYLSNFSLTVFLTFTVCLFFFAVFVSFLYEKEFSKKDPKEIVIDESAGILVSFIGISWSWPHVVMGFLLFRFFDIVNPFPVNWFDKQIKNGWGVVLDDIMAGVYTCLTLHTIRMVWL